MAKYLKKKNSHTHTHTKKLKEVRPDAEGERERSERTSMESTSMELADRPDLAPVRDRGQRQQWAEKRSEGLVVLGYITKSMVLVSPSVKICDFLFFSCSFFFALFRAVSKTVQGVRKIGNLPQGSSFLPTRKSAMYLHFLVRVVFYFFFT